jgi:hypothetical protein
MTTVWVLHGFAWGFLILGTLFSIVYPIEILGKFNLLYALAGFISSLFTWAVVSGYAIIVENNLKSRGE